jgi:hypothetical protein
MYRSSSNCLQYQTHFENNSDITGSGAVVQQTFLEIHETQECSVNVSQTKACSKIFIQSKEQSIVKIFPFHNPLPPFRYCEVGFEHPYVGSPINLAEWSGNVALFSPDGSWIGMTTACLASSPCPSFTYSITVKPHFKAPQQIQVFTELMIN